MAGIRFQVIETYIRLDGFGDLSVRKLNAKTPTVNYITQYLQVLKLYARMNHASRVESRFTCEKFIIKSTLSLIKL